MAEQTTSTPIYDSVKRDLSRILADLRDAEAKRQAEQQDGGEER